MTRVLLSKWAATLIEPALRELPVTPVFLDDGVEGINDIDVAWGSSDVYWDELLRTRLWATVDASPALRWVHTNSSGVESRLFTDIVDRGVMLTRSDVHAPAIAEYVLRSVLQWYQRPHEWEASRRDRAWRKHEFREVLGSTWLIIGFGSIGSEVATRARGFGAHVIGVRRTPRGDEAADLVVGPDRVAEMLPKADVVVLAPPATPDTIGMVNEEFLGRMRPGSVLVNVGRGQLIDEPALFSALDRGVLDAALLDVASSEPPPDDSLLWTHPRIVLTPHTSGHGTGHHHRAAALFAGNLARFVAGEPLENVVTARDTGA